MTYPIVSIKHRGTVSYLGAQARVIELHHDKNSKGLGLRTVIMTWLTDATPENGGYPAGTTTQKIIKGDGRYASFQEIEPTEIVHQEAK